MKTLPLVLTDRTIKPARLCRIERKDGEVIRIAEAQSSINPTGSPDQTYSPIAGVEISAIKHTLGGVVPSLEIRTSHSSTGTFNTSDIDKGLFDAADVTVYIVDRDDPSTLGLMFTGTIQPVSYDVSGKVTFDVRGQAVGARTGYIQKYSPMCRTDLFSPLCSLNEASFAHIGTVDTIINRFNFTVAGLASPPADGWFNGGVIVTDGGVAFEAANWLLSELKITAYLPCNRVITEGEGLTLYPGCDKRIATCLSKFNNTANFQGEPHSLGVYAATTGG